MCGHVCVGGVMCVCSMAGVGVISVAVQTGSSACSRWPHVGADVDAVAAHMHPHPHSLSHPLLHLSPHLFVGVVVGGVTVRVRGRIGDPRSSTTYMLEVIQ